MSPFWLGWRIALKYPPWITYPLTLIILLVIASMALPAIRYRSLVKEVERVARVQQAYFLESGKFTGDLNQLDITLPLLQDKKSARPEYVKDPFLGDFLTSEKTEYTYENGQRFYLVAGKDKTTGLYHMNISGFAPGLPVAYRVAVSYPILKRPSSQFTIHRYCEEQYSEKTSVTVKRALDICHQASASYRQ